MLTRIAKRAGEAWSGIEFLIVAALGTVLFVGLFIIVPFSLARDLLATRPLTSAAVASISVLALLATLRDALRRQWTTVSRAIVALWFLCVLFVALVS